MKKRRVFSLLLVCMLLVSLLPPVQADAASLNKTKTTIVIGMNRYLKVKGTSGKVKWSSTNKKIATVSKTGKVTAKKKGVCYIKAKVKGKTYKCKVTVITAKQAAKKVLAYVKKKHTAKGIMEFERKGRYANFAIWRPQGDGAPMMFVELDLLTGKAYFGSGREEFFNKLPASKTIWK